jgi:membrane protein YdbS with pleckstrin-like domain
MFNLKNLDEHLDSDEKILHFFRPSRLAYLFQYVFHGLLLVMAIFFSIYGEPSSHLFIFWKFVNLAALILLFYSLIMIVRLEYRILSRRYALTTERLLYSRGIFSEKFRSSPYHKVTDIGFHQSLWDKLMDTGTLSVNTAGTDNFEIRYRKVKNPHHIKKMINDGQEFKKVKRK